MGEAGKAQRRAGRTVLGVRWEVGEAGGEPRGGWGGDGGGPGNRRTSSGAGKAGVAGGGPIEGEEKREFKLLTLLVFFK